jgi:hypothetical protein
MNEWQKRRRRSIELDSTGQLHNFDETTNWEMLAVDSQSSLNKR